MASSIPAKDSAPSSDTCLGPGRLPQQAGPGGCGPEPGSPAATVLRALCPVWWVGDALCQEGLVPPGGSSNLLFTPRLGGWSFGVQTPNQAQDTSSNMSKPQNLAKVQSFLFSFSSCFRKHSGKLALYPLWVLATSNQIPVSVTLKYSQL